jgi:hypothetical protein
MLHPSSRFKIESAWSFEGLANYQATWLQIDIGRYFHGHSPESLKSHTDNSGYAPENHTYINTYIHTLHTYIHTYTYTCIHTYTHTYTHTYILIHTYVCTHTECPRPAAALMLLIVNACWWLVVNEVVLPRDASIM